MIRVEIRSCDLGEFGTEVKHTGIGNTTGKALSHYILRSSTIELANLNLNVSDYDLSSLKKN
jgi:hypothetical protein